MTPFAVVRGLTVRHVGRKAPALRDLDMRWDEGERLLLLGPSGAGKSTLALCLDGVIPHALEAHWEAGEVRIRGADTRAVGLAATTRQVGVIFQDPEAQLVALEVNDEIAFGLENEAVPRTEMRERVVRARDEMGLTGPRMPESVDRLSGGSKQRLALAAILAMRPGGIVLDEPTANLDPRGAADVVAALSALAADRTRSLLFIEHRLDAILPLIDRVVAIDAEGRLAFEGAPDAAFGERIDQLKAVGSWVPQLALLGQALGAERRPRTTAEAAALIASRWPRTGGASQRRAATLGPVVLRAEHVSYRFPGASGLAVDDVSIELREGEVLAIVGANGAGKTTCALALAGAIRPTAGRVVLGARDLATADPSDVRSRLAYVFQYPEHQFIARTVREELVATLRSRGFTEPAARLRADDALERDGLAALARADPHTLSHGQKRRLSVATALIGDPQVAILDEPTFGQDRRHSDLLAERIGHLRQAGRTAVVVTHDLGFVADVADRVVAMKDGRVAFDGTPAGLFARPDVLDACGLALPPIAEAFKLARDQGHDLPLLTGMNDVRAALGRAA